MPVQYEGDTKAREKENMQDVKNKIQGDEPLTSNQMTINAKPLIQQQSEASGTGSV